MDIVKMLRDCKDVKHQQDYGRWRHALHCVHLQGSHGHYNDVAGQT